MPQTLTKPFPYVKKTGSSDISQVAAGCVASFTGVKGDLVNLDASGRVQQLVNINTNFNSTNGRFALLNSVLNAAPVGTLAEIEKIDEDTIIVVPALSGTGDGVAVWNANLRGVQCAGRRTSNGAYGAVPSVTTNPVFEIIDVATGQSADAAPWLLVRVLPASRYS
jgi:hypothetical protein